VSRRRADQQLIRFSLSRSDLLPIAGRAAYGRAPVVDTDDHAAPDGNQESSASSTIDQILEAPAGFDSAAKPAVVTGAIGVNDEPPP
jgi:hypothetical protein